MDGRDDFKSLYTALHSIRKLKSKDTLKNQALRVLDPHLHTIKTYVKMATDKKLKVNPKTDKKNDNKAKIKRGESPISGSLKDVEKRRRQVFKPVLDNPYTQSNLWPFVEPEVSETLLELISHIFSKLGHYNKLVGDRATNEEKTQGFVKPDEPEILKHITVGFNSTVKALERQAQDTRDQLQGKKKTEGSKESGDELYIKYVFVTKFEISPSLLLQPFPVLSRVASKSQGDRVKLIQLPRGSQKKLSEILNIPHVSIIGISNKIVEAQAIYDIVDERIKDVEVPWIDKMIEDGMNMTFTKPVLKVLSTSAPILPKKNDQKKKKKQNTGDANESV